MNPYAPPGASAPEAVFDWLGTLESLSASESDPETLASRAAKVVGSLDNPQSQIESADMARLSALHPLAAAPVLAAASLDTLSSFRKGIRPGQEGSPWSQMVNLAEQAKCILAIRSIRFKSPGILLPLLELVFLGSGLAGIKALSSQGAESLTVQVAAFGLMVALIATHYGTHFFSFVSNRQKRARLNALDRQAKEAFNFAETHGFRYRVVTEIQTLFYCAKEFAKMAGDNAGGTK